MLALQTNYFWMPRCGQYGQLGEGTEELPAASETLQP